MYTLLYTIKSLNHIEDFMSHIVYGRNEEITKGRIGDKKVNIDSEKVNIDSLKLITKFKSNILSLYNNLCKKEYFGRYKIINILKMSPSGAFKLISKLLEFKVIIPISSHGKVSIFLI